MSSCGWVVASPPRWRGPQSERPSITGLWGRRCRGTRGPARSRERPWVCRSVHRSAKMGSRSRFGAFVYTVATLWTDVRTQECTQIGKNGLSTPFLGHLCTLLRRDSPRRQPTLTPEEPQKSRKTRDDPRGAPTKGRPSRGGARPFPGRSVSRTSRMPYRTRLAPHLSYRRGGAHPYCNTHGKPQRAAGAMNVASVHNEASLCPTVTGLSAEAQRNEPERSRRRARSAPIPTGCARVC